MSDVDVPGADPAGAPAGRPYDPDRTRFLAAGVLWLAAAVLAVVAAYQDVYAVDRASGARSGSLDAWGTFHGAIVQTSTIHGPAYGRVLVACTVLFALLAASSLGRAFGLRAPRFDGAALAAGVGVVGGLAGLVVALYLYVTSQLDYLQTVLAGQFDIVTTVGPCSYFALAALVCGAVAVFASGTRRARPATTA